MTFWSGRRRGGDRNGAAAGDCGGLGNHGRAARARKRGHCVVGQFDRHRRRLYMLIVIFGPISGAHFNPVVSAVSVWHGIFRTSTASSTCVAQIGGAFAGVVAAHAMFGLPIVQVSAHVRPTFGEGLRRSYRNIRSGAGDRSRFEVSRRGDPHGSCRFHYRAPTGLPRRPRSPIPP